MSTKKDNSMSSPAKAAEIVDLDDFIKKWAVQLFDITKNREQARISKDNLEFTVNWNRTKFVHNEPTFAEQTKPSTPKSHVLFKTLFTNSTDLEQEYCFKTERTTCSTCEVFVERAVTTGTEISLNLKTPCEVFEAHAGFKRELTLTKTQGEVIEESLTWGVDSAIKVPPHHRASAELVIYEDEFEGNFVVHTEFSGKVHVSVTNSKDNNSFVKSIEGDVDQIMKRELDNGLKGFSIDKGIVSFNTNGRCRFRYGIEQHVKISQELL